MRLSLCLGGVWFAGWFETKFQSNQQTRRHPTKFQSNQQTRHHPTKFQSNQHTRHHPTKFQSNQQTRRHPNRVTNTSVAQIHRFSPDDGYMDTRNMQRREINILSRIVQLVGPYLQDLKVCTVCLTRATFVTFTKKIMSHEMKVSFFMHIYSKTYFPLICRSTGVLINPQPDQEGNKLQLPNSNFCKHSKKFRKLSVQPGLRESNDLRVGGKMAKFQFFFFQYGRAKDLVALLYLGRVMLEIPP